ncbi:MAG TPA: SDR family oxidoreductase [Bacillales bacterium]|nr:SDR family oxidoreductase [Bacillales bacterium]
MKLLILGGTVFLGRHIVESALDRSHEVTMFNRGQHNPDLFPQVEKLIGDRDGDLTALKRRKWDAVIDTSGYVPRIVRDSAEILADAVDHYTFISSISVYRDFTRENVDESDPVQRLDDETVEEVTGETYGALKALCEEAAEDVMPGRTLVIRPGLIVGPHDPTDRFTYWPYRIAQGGEVLAPGNPDAPVQFIDVRDLAEWVVSMVELRKTGVFNATGPESQLSMKKFLEASQSVSGHEGSLTWVSEKFLAEKEVGHWIELPLWVPSSEGMPGFSTVDCRKAVAENLTFRPLGETIQDTLDWVKTRPEGYQWQAGMDRKREQELLRKFS